MLKKSGNDELDEAIRGLEGVAQLSERLRNDKQNRTMPILCTFFGMLCAFKIRLQLKSMGQDEIAFKVDETEGPIATGEIIPMPSCVRSTATNLVAGSALRDKAKVASALEEMGVIGLCPNLSEQIARMRQLASLATGRTKVALLVELALLAVEADASDQTRALIAETRSFDPDSWELYSLRVAEGLLAFNAGRPDEALQAMSNSICACQIDEYTSLACSIRGLNLALVGKLLSHGYREEVSRHLMHCRDIWQSLRPQIDVWISLIASGEKPDFDASGMVKTMNAPMCRLQLLCSKARFFDEDVHSPGASHRIPKSRAEVLAGRERLRAEYKRNRERFNKGPAEPGES